MFGKKILTTWEADPLVPGGYKTVPFGKGNSKVLCPQIHYQKMDQLTNDWFELADFLKRIPIGHVGITTFGDEDNWEDKEKSGVAEGFNQRCIHIIENCSGSSNSFNSQGCWFDYNSAIFI